MAKFNVNTNTAAATPAAGNWERAAGFLNFYLPVKGTDDKKKLGSIGLKLSVPDEKKLNEALSKGPEEAERIVKAILSKLIIEYRSATPSEPTAGFDIY